MHDTTPGQRFDAAFAWARQVHAGQLRKGTAIPYLAHLLAVASLVFEEGGDEDQAIAALLHDAPEDCGGAEILREIGRRFGPRVAGIVEACSDTLLSPKPPWRERKERYLVHLRSAVPSEALVVSVADKVHNARSVLLDYRDAGPELWDRFRGGRDGTLWYHRELLAAYRSRPEVPARLVGELARILDALESLVEAREGTVGSTALTGAEGA